MTDVQHHIVRRQVLDVDVVGTESDALALQRRLRDLCQDWLWPALDGVLGRLVPADEHWIIDRLDIDAGSFRAERLERDLVDAAVQAVERRLRERAGDRTERRSQGRVAPDGRERAPPDLTAPTQRRTEAQSILEALRHFLETGVLPWWFHLPAGRTLEDAVRAAWRTPGQPEHFGHALCATLASASVRARLVRQFSTDVLGTLLATLSPDGAAAMRGVQAEVGKQTFAPEVRRRLLEELWQIAFADAGGRQTAESIVAGWLESRPEPGAGWPTPQLLERLSQLWPGARSGAGEQRDRAPHERAADDRTHGAKPAPMRDAPAARIDLAEGVHVGCAGVVLLHPFLPRLFEALGVARDDQLAQPGRALGLLHFLATGERRAPEYELLLPKLLCNLPLEAPVESPVALTAAEEDEAVALLEAVIRHWATLGDTSIDALRGTFLARPGRLSRRGDGDDVLQVETRSFDVLLDRLPWGIGAIQLPWMERILWVEWRF